jgi:hypothetical protein
LTETELQSAGRRRNILRARCTVALIEQQTAAIGPMRETSPNRISYRFFTVKEPIYRQNGQKLCQGSTRGRKKSCASLRLSEKVAI